MDLRLFYQEMRRIEEGIADPHVVVVSRVTVDGGKAGVRTEVTREAAARMIAEARCRMADEQETLEFRAAQLDALKERNKAILTSRWNVNVLSDEELSEFRKAASKPISS